MRDWRQLDAAELLFLDDFDCANAPIITAVLTIAGEVDAEWVLANVASRFTTHPRFRSIIREHRNAYRFEIDPSFDLHNHVVQHKTPPSDVELNKLLSTNLADDKPFWELHVFSPVDGTTEVVGRAHHIICDGVSMARYFAEHVVDEELPPNEAEPTTAVRQRNALNTELARLGAMPSSWEGVTRPFRDGFAALFGMLIPDPPSYLTASTLGAKKEALWTRKRSVDELLVASRALGVTINDLALGALAGAMRTHFKVVTNAEPPVGLTCGIPVNQHVQGSGELWNAVTLLLLALPSREMTRPGRMAACIHAMRDMKAGYRAPLMRLIVYVMGQLPGVLRRALYRRAARCASFIFSNVRGPERRVTIGGRQVERIRPLAGALGDCGVSMTLFSYGGQVETALWFHPDRLPNAPAFAVAFDDELDAIVKDANQSSIA